MRAKGKRSGYFSQDAVMEWYKVKERRSAATGQRRDAHRR
jgi:hypothetical protein